MHIKYKVKSKEIKSEFFSYAIYKNDSLIFLCNISDTSLNATARTTFLFFEKKLHYNVNGRQEQYFFYKLIGIERKYSCFPSNLFYLQGSSNRFKLAIAFQSREEKF